MVVINIGRIPTKWAHLDGEREALIDVPSGRRMTFAALDEYVRRLANGLRDELGLALGDRVAVLSRNSIEYQALYFACGRAGLIAQPLNWRLGEVELSRILADGDPRAVIVAEEFGDVAATLAGQLGIPHVLTVTPDGSGSLAELVARAGDHI